jgi:cyclohexanecarboxylate-CoA ligase
MAIRDIYHDVDRIRHHQQSGQWPDSTLDDYLQQHAQERSDKLVIIDRRWRLTFADLDRLARRAACGLLHLGLTSGDVISIQTPNWAEWLIMHCAATKIGAVTNSIGAVYRHREVGYILDYAETALMRIPDTFRGFSYTAMLAELWPKLTCLRHVLVIGDDVPPGMHSFQRFLDTPWEDQYSATHLAALRPDPNRVATLMFTSGTEANPKGVMHTHNTVVMGTRQVREIYDLGSDDVVFMASPIGHTTALVVGARMPVMYAITAVWQEHWNPETAVDLIAGEGCTFTVSATSFLYGLVHAANVSRDTLKTLRTFSCGGAPIPRELIRRAEDKYGFLVSAIYGSSERSSTAPSRSTISSTSATTPTGRSLLVSRHVWSMPTPARSESRAKRVSFRCAPLRASPATTRTPAAPVTCAAPTAGTAARTISACWTPTICQRGRTQEGHDQPRRREHQCP